MTDEGVESDEMAIYRWQKGQRNVKKNTMMSSEKHYSVFTKTL
jgi:hypothetical protein